MSNEGDLAEYLLDDELDAEPGTELEVATFPGPAAETLSERYTRQGIALRTAANASPLPLYRGKLNSMANELRDVVKALAQAEGSEIEGAEVVTAGSLSRGVRLYWVNDGPGTVMRTANGFTGIEVHWDDVGDGRGPSFVNVLGPESPVVVIP